MAKVTGPLYSMSASGKIANAMVFFGWKGIACVRQWVVPANPQSASQGDVRVVMGGLGRGCGKVVAESAFHQQLIDLGLIPSGQTKQSYLVKYIGETFLAGPTAYSSELAALTGHTSYAAFQASADALSIVEFDLDYASVDAFDKALGLFELAKTAIAKGFTGTPYTTALNDWVTTDVEGMVSDMTGL